MNSLRSQCLKEPNLQPFQDLWESANASFDSDHYQDAIECLTTAVSEIEQRVLAVTLLKRAIAFSCQGNLQAGIKDAEKVMELAPTLFEGYLCAGRLLQLAGEKSKAVAVYKKGIGAVSGQCSEYEQLIRAKRALEGQIQEANTALFKKLPFELLAHIFSDLLSFKDRLQCMFTCRAWQDFFLEDLPQVSRQVILWTMPKDSMVRLLETVRSKSHGGLLPRDGQTHQVSILPGTSVAALQNALDLLSQESWRGRIGYLDICADLDSLPNMKPMLDRLLQQNNDNLKRVAICSSKDTGATVNALNVCSKLSHLLVAAHHSLLANDASSVTTHSGRKVKSDSTPSTAVAIEYGLERLLYGAHREGIPNNLLTMSANPAWLAEQQRAHLQRMIHNNNFPQTNHVALKRLELVGMEAFFFTHPNFWERLPNLEHITFRDPVDRPGNMQSIANITQNVGQYCLRLKTFRYGGGWQECLCNENGVIPIVEDAQEQEGLHEICVRISTSNRLVNVNNAMIVPNLVSANKNYGALTVLVLQMEALTVTGLQSLTSIHLPRLTEFQLHQKLFSGAYRIPPELFAPVASHFPALEKIVMNNIQTCDDALFELSKARHLRFAHLKAFPVLQPNDGLDIQQRISQVRLQLMTAQAQTATAQTAAAQTAAAQIAAAQIAATRSAAALPPPASMAHPLYNTTMTIYTKFINNCTMLSDVCLCGPTVQDSDLYSLVTNNRNLSTVSLILCVSLTSNGIASAFSCAGDDILSSSPSSIRHVTLANMSLEGGEVVSSLTRLPRLEKLTFIACEYSDIQLSILSSFKYRPSRKSAFEVYCLQNLESHEGILYKCIPDQQLVITRSVPSVPIVKPFADFL